MAKESLESGDERIRWGYFVAITASALGHLLLIAVALIVVPRYFRARFIPPPSYSVKIVDSLPAGDLGTHLPRLSHAPAAVKPAPELAKSEPPKPPIVSKPEPPSPPSPPVEDKTAIALNTTRTPAVTPTSPPPAPQATSAPTPAPAAKPKRKATPAPTATPQRHPKAAPTPHPKEKSKKNIQPRPKPTIEMARAESTPSVREQLDKIRQQLLAQHLKAKKKAEVEKESEEEEPAEEGGGSVVANKALEGRGMGIGAGSGSAGALNDLDFLLYYRTVQERIKKAWSFAGGDADLATTVTFAIGSDGGLMGVKISRGSSDVAFDDSVVRAIKRAAPFPPPPEKYRGQFAQGVEALFKLGELNS